MDESNLREHLRQMEALVSFVIRDSSSEGGQTRIKRKPHSAASSDDLSEAVSCKTTASSADVVPGDVTPPPTPRREDLLSSPSSVSLPAPAPEPEPEPAPSVAAAARTNGSQTNDDEVQEAEQPRTTADRTERISAQTQSELERAALHSSAMVATAEKFRRRRQSLIGLFYRGLMETYRDVRAEARRTFISECAADIGRIKQTGHGGYGGGQRPRIYSPCPVSPSSAAVANADISGAGTFRDAVDSNDTATITNNSNDNSTSSSGVNPAPEAGVKPDPTAGVGPEAVGCRERTRVTRELRSEAARVARWDKLQREVLRRSTAEVANLLEIDGLRQAPIDGGGSGGADAIQVLYARRLVPHLSPETDRNSPLSDDDRSNGGALRRKSFRRRYLPCRLCSSYFSRWLKGFCMVVSDRFGKDTTRKL